VSFSDEAPPLRVDQLAVAWNRAGPLCRADPGR
jgi:hypothetical protein